MSNGIQLDIENMLKDLKSSEAKIKEENDLAAELAKKREEEEAELDAKIAEASDW